MLRLPRVWYGCDLPGYREAEQYSTYGGWPLDDLPPIERRLDPELEWLRHETVVSESLAESPRSPDPLRPATAAQLNDLVASLDLSLPPAFALFVTDPDLRARLRSCTACYLDLGQVTVPVLEGGHLVHFLSDQQWVLHWLLFVGAHGEEVVVATNEPYGFVGDDIDDVFDPTAGTAVICADTFGEFVYRFWIENEIWFALSEEPRPLTGEERRYLEFYDSR